jgi:hypothetical protein
MPDQCFAAGFCAARHRARLGGLGRRGQTAHRRGSTLGWLRHDGNREGGDAVPRAYASSVINASAAEVWAVIRDFNALPKWHPGIAESAIENGRPADAVGCIRSFKLKDGAHLRERLLHLSDVDRSYSYDFQKTPFEVQNYHATLRVTPVTDGNRCFIEWWTTFDCAPAESARWIDTFANGVFQGGFDALKQRFGG